MESRESSRIPVAVLGGTGYVAAELLRLIARHPSLTIGAVVSREHAGLAVLDAFPHLRGVLPDGLTFRAFEDWRADGSAGAVAGLFLALPHGETSRVVADLFQGGEPEGLCIVDVSADFRFPDPARFERIYGVPHAARDLAKRFVSLVPEQAGDEPCRFAAQPGCFATAVTLAAWPFARMQLIEGPVFASAVTGSSGSGRKPRETTHHPARRSDLFAYSPLAHRHEPEMRRLIGYPDSREWEVEFVAHSGPMVRGIHATVRMTLREPTAAAELVDRVNAFYGARGPFVRASIAMPHLTSVVGTNRCDLGVAVRGRTLVVTSVLDNLIKGAAGGAVQWMNRCLGLPPDSGLRLDGLGWF